MGGKYEVCRWHGLSRHDIHTKFHKDWLKHSKVNEEGGIHRETHRTEMTYALQSEVLTSLSKPQMQHKSPTISQLTFCGLIISPLN
jgi:hypothetical protein